MEITIDKKNYELKLSLKGVNYLDEIYKVKTDYGVSFGMGINYVVSALDTLNASVIFNLIKASLLHIKERPNDCEIEKYIEDRFDEDIDGFLKEINDFLLSQPFSKAIIRRINPKVKEKE